jgi:predicted Zn-dependent protease
MVMTAGTLLVFAINNAPARPRVGPRTAHAAQPPPAPAREASPGPHGTPEPVDAAETQAKAALEKDPEDLNARLELARIRLDKEDYMSVMSETERILKRSPGNARAMTYQSQVRLMMGQPQVALEMLKQAVAKEPTFLQAYIYLSYVYLGLGKDAEAKATITAAKLQYPAQSAWLDNGFAEMKANVDKFGPPFQAAGPNPHQAGGADRGPDAPARR